MDPVWIAVAFLFGLAARQVKQPPLIGYLVAGFLLHALGFSGGETLQQIADLGVTLLLFSIGLRLRITTLLQPEIWAGAAAHMAITVAVFGLLFFGLALAGLPVFTGLSLETAFLIAFALSFSSTVFAVKTLEKKNELATMHGRVSIGILIMQDIFAVLFVAFAGAEIPSPWALALLLLIPARPLLIKLLDYCGHGELMPLFGLFAALVLGAQSFELVGLKADLGALMLGLLLAGHRKAGAISASLLNFKDLFLVGFFLNIGLTGAPSPETVALAAVLVVLLPFKIALFHIVLTRFRLRARSAVLASFSLATYSEFGLIVGAAGLAQAWLSADWLIVMALALSATFVLAAPLNAAANGIYDRFASFLQRFETRQRHRDDRPFDPGPAQIIVIGMGGIGSVAYDVLRQRHGDIVLGLDHDAEKVAQLAMAGRRVFHADALDSDFWAKLKAIEAQPLKVAILAMPEHGSNLFVAEQLKDMAFPGIIAAIVRYPDEVQSLEELDIDLIFNINAEAGAGYGNHVADQLRHKGISFDR